MFCKTVSLKRATLRRLYRFVELATENSFIMHISQNIAKKTCRKKIDKIAGEGN